MEEENQLPFDLWPLYHGIHIPIHNKMNKMLNKNENDWGGGTHIGLRSLLAHTCVHTHTYVQHTGKGKCTISVYTGYRITRLTFVCVLGPCRLILLGRYLGSLGFSLSIGIYKKRQNCPELFEGKVQCYP